MTTICVSNCGKITIPFQLSSKVPFFLFFRTLRFQPQLQQRYAKIADSTVIAWQGKLPNLQWQFLGQLSSLQQMETTAPDNRRSLFDFISGNQHFIFLVAVLIK